ncbi:hypothetical protein G7Y89_g14003 [Cudoniella acicularis]|uniref:Uncharacterized protein n=1 Tax=Cudoniella acicularis TaxID=354080 RepID=A0A8H4R8P7_9HELO|nr:hypothetical protein G7Y89_g14003 [Cudoniella acicularis]
MVRLPVWVKTSLIAICRRHRKDGDHRHWKFPSAGTSAINAADESTDGLMNYGPISHLMESFSVKLKLPNKTCIPDLHLPFNALAYQKPKTKQLSSPFVSPNSAMQSPDRKTKPTKASTPEKAMAPPTFTHFAGAQTSFKPPLIANENAFLGDIATSEPLDPVSPISAGFYRLEKGTPLVYEYTYHEMKIIVDGEFDISDETGKKVHAVKGDVFYLVMNDNHNNITIPLTHKLNVLGSVANPMRGSPFSLKLSIFLPLLRSLARRKSHLPNDYVGLKFSSTTTGLQNFFSTTNLKASCYREDVTPLTWMIRHLSAYFTFFLHGLPTITTQHLHVNLQFSALLFNINRVATSHPRGSILDTTPQSALQSATSTSGRTPPFSEAVGLLTILSLVETSVNLINTTIKSINNLRNLNGGMIGCDWERGVGDAADARDTFALAKRYDSAHSTDVAPITVYIGFSYWLGTQTFNCPSWALNCNVRPSVTWIIVHLPLVQGIISTIHGLGLALLAYPAFIFAEAALWPILTHSSYTLASIDMYLSATRGSVPGLIQAISNIGRGHAFIVMLWVGIITLFLQADRIVVGQAYNLGNVTQRYQSIYMGGGGIGLPFLQHNPPGPLPGPTTIASSFFSSWSQNLSAEPLPTIRSFITDRVNLSRVGIFSISGLEAQKIISCTGKELTIVDDVDSNGGLFSVASNFSISSNSILLRLQPRLSVWVNQVEYKSLVRTITTLVFASMNGTIENGLSTHTATKMKSFNYFGISTLECTVDVTLQQVVATVGAESNNMTVANVSSLQTVLGPANNASPYGDLGDVAEWTGAIVATLGVPVYGAQPLFQAPVPPNTLPTIVTTTQTQVTPEVWTQDTLMNFIAVASGALALAMSTQWNTANVTLYSEMSVLQVVKGRCWILAVPAAVVLVLEVLLVMWVSYSNRRAGIREMRQAKTSDVVWSTQNKSISDSVKAEEYRTLPEQAKAR